MIFYRINKKNSTAKYNFTVVYVWKKTKIHPVYIRIRIYLAATYNMYTGSFYFFFSPFFFLFITSLHRHGYQLYCIWSTFARVCMYILYTRQKYITTHYRLRQCRSQYPSTPPSPSRMQIRVSKVCLNSVRACLVYTHNDDVNNNYYTYNLYGKRTNGQVDGSPALKRIYERSKSRKQVRNVHYAYIYVHRSLGTLFEAKSLSWLFLIRIKNKNSSQFIITIIYSLYFIYRRILHLLSVQLNNGD